MILLKLCYHISAAVSKLFYKLIYGRRLKIGKNTTWRRQLSIMISKEGRVEIGKNCFFNNYCAVNSCNLVTIGDNTLLGEGVKIYDHNHRFSDPDLPVEKQGFSVGAVSIGKDCWIGSNVTILKGAVIGDRCVIGAGAVVSGNIPSGTLVRVENTLKLEEIRWREEK